MSYIRVCMHFVCKNCIAVNAVCISLNENRHILSHHCQFLHYLSTTVNVPLKNNETKPVFLSYDYNSLYRLVFTSTTKSCSSYWPYFGDSFAASANSSHSSRKITVSCLSLQVFSLINFSLFFITS